MFINSLLSSLENDAEKCLPAALRSRINAIVVLMPRMNPDQNEHAQALILKLNRILEGQYAFVAPDNSYYSTIPKIQPSQDDFHSLTLVEQVQIAA